MIYKYNIDFSECGNCMSKIESKIENLQEIDRVKINFIEKKILVFSSIENEKKIRDLVVHEGLKFDSSFKIVDDEVKNNKNLKLLILGSGVLLIIFIVNIFFTFPVYIYLFLYISLGYKIFVKAFKNIKQGEFFDENILMIIATLGAMIIGQYKEAIAVFLFFMVGEAFQDFAVNKSKDRIESILSVDKEDCQILDKENGEFREGKTYNLKVGDIIYVPKGDKIPMDSVLLSKSGIIDNSFLTGESDEQEVSSGGIVLGGGINCGEGIKLKISKSFEDSQIGEIDNMIMEANFKKSKREDFIKRFAKIYTPIVVALAFIYFVVSIFIRGSASFDSVLYNSLILLVISCPCALVISVPLAYFAGIGRASSEGILVKGGDILENMRKINKIFLDKTGTLTTGNMEVSEIFIENGFDEEILSIIYTMEKKSNHPIARGIVKYLIANKNVREVPLEITETPGRGLIGIYKSKEVAIGNKKLLKEKFQLEILGDDLYFVIDGKVGASIKISDTIKKESMNIVEDFRHRGIKEITILSGDRKFNVEKVGKILKIENVYGELSPGEKSDILFKSIREKNKKDWIAFVGDGINDAPSLALADVGISMGGNGSDLAISSSDVVIKTDNLSKILEGKIIGRKLNNVIIENIIIIFSIKGVVIILGVFGLSTLWEAVIADVGVSIIAILNTLRIMRVKKLKK